jgi:DNA-binding GntR family transcriptional regulator
MEPVAESRPPVTQLSAPLPAPRPAPQLSEQAATYVRDQITSGMLHPGARVRPEDVAAELGISPTPAREALQTLRSEGLLDLVPRRGFMVARVSGDDIRDIYQAQAMVAGELAARAAAQATDTQLDRMRAIHIELEAAAAAGDMVDLEEQNHAFHREINLAAGAPKLAWVVQMLSKYAPRRFYASIDGWAQTTLDDHSGVLEALVSRDVEVSRALMAAHLIHAGEQLARRVEDRLAALAVEA